MSKFYKFINEESDWEQVVKSLEKRCMPFLKEFDGPIYRGYNKGIQGKMSRKATRKDRKPRFIPEDVHNEMDNVLYDMFGWYPRSNGVFTGSEGVAREFATNISKVYLFFPVGNYEYIWTEQYPDIYMLYDELSRAAKVGDYEPDTYEQVKQQLFDNVRNFYHEKYLNKMIINHRDFEAIFNCESFYLVDTDIFIDYDEFFMEEY